MISLDAKIVECGRQIAKNNGGGCLFEQIEKELRGDPGLAYCRMKDGRKRRNKAERIQRVKLPFVGIPRSWAERSIFDAVGLSLAPVWDEGWDDLGRKPLVGFAILDPTKPAHLLETLTLDDKVNEKTGRQVEKQIAGVKSHAVSGFYKPYTAKQLTPPRHILDEVDRIKVLVGKRKGQLQSHFDADVKARIEAIKEKHKNL